MRKLIVQFIVTLLICSQFGYSAPVFAEAPLVIGVLDLRTIRAKSLAIKDIRGQIKKYETVFQADIKKEEDALRIANQKLAKRRTLLSPDAFAKERRIFEQKVVSVQKLVQQQKVKLDRALNSAMLVVEKKMNMIVAEVATKRGAKLVLRRQNTFLADRSMDMTNDVLTRLNEELKTVSVNKPGSK